MNPILLVHGIIDKSKVFNKMSFYLQNNGYDVYSINLTPNNGTADLRVLAQKLKEYIDDQFKPNQKINLIGFSMGGLITRYYLQRLEGLEKVDKYVSISTPNNGTKMAYMLPFIGTKQMRPHSDFLEDLNRDIKNQFSHLDCLILWTPFDLMITPASSSILPVGKSLNFPVLLHKWMISDVRVFKAVDSFLNSELKI